MKKLIFIIFGSLALILAIGLIAIWQTLNLATSESLETIASKLQKISSPGNKSTEENQYREFISPDGKFGIVYPSDWSAIENENLLQAMAPEELEEKHGLKTLFLAQNFQESKFGQLVVYRGIFEIPVEDIFEKIREINHNNGWIVETLDLKTSVNEGIFEGKYENMASVRLRSREKILLSGKEGYWIAFFALEKDWINLEADVDKIFNSVKITQN